MQAVSNGQHCTVMELLSDGCLDQLISSKVKIAHVNIPETLGSMHKIYKWVSNKN
jgi:hypothetical protein